ncbi:MAG: YdeI/OmpD-associated family protein [Fibrobacteria bacterium]
MSAGISGKKGLPKEGVAAGETRNGLLILAFKSDKEWGAWLGKNNVSSKGIWIRLAKKSISNPSVTYEEAVLTALCHGWIDGQKASADASAWLQKFTPRGPRSIWSKLNRDRIAKLSLLGRMTPAGEAAVARAKLGGQWQAAYDSPKGMGVSAEFQAELDKSKSAAAFFAGLDSANRYSILWRIHNAKKPETKARHIAKYIAMLKKKEKLHP